jgi:hypothetical protein
MTRWALLPVCAFALHAQAVKDYDFHLDNGAEVLYQTYGQADARDPSPNLGTARAFGNTIERNVMDGQNARQLGFQLRIEKLAGDPIRFRISMGPENQWGFFGRSAPPREIQNGDRVLLDVLEEPATGRKISDTFQVGIGIGMHTMPTAKTVPQTPQAGAVIRLQNPEFLAGTSLLAKASGSGKNASGVSGATIGLLVPGKGWFRFSTRPEPGYRMEGIAEGNVLMFVVGSERFDIQCASPVMDGAGAWYVWVRHDAADFRMGAPTLELTLP